MTEDQAREYLESLRWPEGPFCPHCGSVKAMRLTGKSCRPGLCKCSDCRKQFTVTVGTIMERSHIALRHWVYAFTRMCSSKKGISAHQLHRELGITYKAAWFMCHRIRHAFFTRPDDYLSGVVEVDETHVGARKPRYPRGNDNRVKAVRGTTKQPVLALVERGGRVRTKVIPDVSGPTLREAICFHVDPKSTIMTDEWRGYIGVGKLFAGGHKTVTHRRKEYVRPGGVTTNTVESFFATMKRGLIGTFHHVGRQHLHRYCNEFSFRWNNRKVNDVERAEAAIRQVGGKRLTYAAPAA